MADLNLPRIAEAVSLAEASDYDPKSDYAAKVACLAGRPPTGSFAVTKSDQVIYWPPLKRLYVGGAGDVALMVGADSAAVTLEAVPVGTTIEMLIRRVMETNTSATKLVGFR